MKRLSLALSVLILFAGSAEAAITYDYVGNNFTSVPNGTLFTTSDKITGFVTFATAPTANETNKPDVSAFSISAGPVTITESSPSLSTIFSFDFDAGLNIVDWEFDAQAEVFSSATSEPEELWTYLISSDAASTGDPDSLLGSISGAADNLAVNFNSPGTWTARQDVIPEPSSLIVWATILGFAVTRRRRRM